MAKIHVVKDETFISRLEKSLQKNDLTSWDLFQLNYDVQQATVNNDFSKLYTLSYVPHVQFLQHQVDAAKKVMHEMNGRAILADEVGLGKTIEAGLILKEYLIRGLVQNALILVPASLINQWIDELRNKFYISAASFRKGYRWDDYPIFVTSLEMAKRSPHREKLSKMEFDLVIVDEAHKLKNNKTLNYSFVHSLQKKYCLLLTATPMQNDIKELFHLISIIKPGLLGNDEQFISKSKRKRVRQINDAYVKRMIQKVMIRNVRKDTIDHDVKRNVHNVWITFSEAEQSVYDSLHSILKKHPSLSKITFLRALCSSREACYLSLQNSTNEQLKKDVEHVLEAIAQLPHHKKAIKLVELIESFQGEKVIVFTEFRATQYYLQWFLNEHGIRSVSFRGGLRRGQKDWLQQMFAQNVQVFLTTEAGGEGINLQFCRYMINYDLPWNPLRLEQRIGRIHRYGQKHDIHIYNFALKQTIEEQLVTLLYDKIAQFERVIGELDDILETLHIQDLGKEMMHIMEHSSSTGEMKIKVDHLFSIIEDCSKSYGEYDEA